MTTASADESALIPSLVERLWPLVQGNAGMAAQRIGETQAREITDKIVAAVLRAASGADEAASRDAATKVLRNCYETVQRIGAARALDAWAVQLGLDTPAAVEPERDLAQAKVLEEAAIEGGIEAGWREFERITSSPLPLRQGGYTPSRGAFSFSFKAGLRCALSPAATPHQETDHG